MIHEFEDADQAGAGHDALDGHPAVEPGPEEAPQVQRPVVAGREIGVAALGRGRHVTPPIPEQDRLSEAGSRGNHRPVGRPGRTRLQHVESVVGKKQRAVRGGFQVVQQPDPASADCAAQPSLIDLPRQIRGRDLAVEHRTGNAERRGSPAF